MDLRTSISLISLHHRFWGDPPLLGNCSEVSGLSEVTQLRAGGGTEPQVLSPALTWLKKACPLPWDLEHCLQLSSHIAGGRREKGGAREAVHSGRPECWVKSGQLRERSRFPASIRPVLGVPGSPRPSLLAPRRPQVSPLPRTRSLQLTPSAVSLSPRRCASSTSAGPAGTCGTARRACATTAP